MVEGMDTAQFPVEMVSWNDAVEFCHRLSSRPGEEQAGNLYRLPTEAEWEYACRADTTTPFNFGNSASSTQANFNGDVPYGGAAKGPYLQRTAKVGQYEPNSWGLYDMHANVDEWCSDRYDPKYYDQHVEVDPQGSPAAADDRRALRGGSWNGFGVHCRSAFRERFDNELRGATFGFRVVCETEASIREAEKGKAAEDALKPTGPGLLGTGLEFSDADVAAYKKILKAPGGWNSYFDEYTSVLDLEVKNLGIGGGNKESRRRSAIEQMLEFPGPCGRSIQALRTVKEKWAKTFNKKLADTGSSVGVCTAIVVLPAFVIESAKNQLVGELDFQVQGRLTHLLDGYVEALDNHLAGRKFGGETDIMFKENRIDEINTELREMKTPIRVYHGLSRDDGQLGIDWHGADHE